MYSFLFFFLASLTEHGHLKMHPCCYVYQESIPFIAEQCFIMVALVVKNPPANAGDARDLGSVPGSGRSPGVGYSNSLQYFCLENTMDRGDWQATVHEVTKSQTQLSN